jgi:hypothetical protein
MIGTALPLYQQILIDVCLPPVMTAIFWLILKAPARALGNSDNPAAKGWSNSRVWVLLATLYAIMFSVTIYGCFK